MNEQQEQMHLVYYINNQVLNFRVSDGRTGAEPLALRNETEQECIVRLRGQLGLPETACTLECIGAGTRRRSCNIMN